MEPYAPTLNISTRWLNYYDVGKHSWTVNPGEFKIYVAHSAAQIDLTATVRRLAP